MCAARTASPPRPFTSRRVGALPPYVFARLDHRIAALRAEGRTIVDLGKADPDHPTPAPAVEALRRAALDPANYHYPPFEGLDSLRRAVAAHYRDRHGVDLDPQREVLILPGSKGGLCHISLGVCDPGDVALVPDPSFPAYRMGAHLAGAAVHLLPLRPRHGHLPDLDAVPGEVMDRARILFLNYPNNPTGAVASPAWFRHVAEFARGRGLLVCHDLAYGESGFDGYRPPSFLAADGARDVGIEFITWSKPFCMPGWRLGAAVGNADAVRSLYVVESQINAGVFGAVQEAGREALLRVTGSGFIEATNDGYRSRRDRMVRALASMGLDPRPPQATPYLWTAVPPGFTSDSFADRLLEDMGIAVTPGSAFGPHGEGYFRISLTASDADVDIAIRRLQARGAALAKAPYGG